jgi:hypothetical protein
MINMLVPVQQNGLTHLRVLLVLTDRGIEKLSNNSTAIVEQIERMAADPKEGDFWQADHIVPVAEGGGECDLSNYRTLWYINNHLTCFVEIG